MKKWTLPLALTTAVIYVALSISASLCLFTHDAAPRTAHHHAGGTTHSSLCAWACQANQTVDLVDGAPHSHLLALVAFVYPWSAVQASVLALQSTQSRAPPHS